MKPNPATRPPKEPRRLPFRLKVPERNELIAYALATLAMGLMVGLAIGPMVNGAAKIVPIIIAPLPGGEEETEVTGTVADVPALQSPAGSDSGGDGNTNPGEQTLVATEDPVVEVTVPDSSDDPPPADPKSEYREPKDEAVSYTHLQQGFMAPFSFTADGGEVFGRSFFAAGAIMSLIALPFVVGGTREALNAVPKHVREASYALGKDQASTIRRVLIPSARGGIATGTTLGMAQIVGETAVVVVLLGATLQIAPEGTVPVLDIFKGTGSTLTSYVYQNSPAGEGNAPEKAYAAAFVLMLIVVALNLIVNLISRKGQQQWG